jgi:peptide-methionine (S)-S-oxide reductase
MPGVVATCVGYTGGSVGSPTYHQVCGGWTGHSEGVQLLFDAQTVSYEEVSARIYVICYMLY